MKKKISHAETKCKRAWLAILVSEKIEFKTKNITRDKKENSIMIRDQFIRKIEQS